MLAPFNLNAWIEEHKHLLKPPVGNQCIYTDAKDFIVMVVGGPNSRKDFHYNKTEELFLQLKGDIVVKTFQDGKVVDIPIKEGEIFLLPGGVPHSPQRGENTIGIVLEKVREGNEEDGFFWYCENCNEKIYETYLNVSDIVKNLPPVMDAFYASEENRTCKKCNHIMEAPKKLN